ncbi:hypothetical protein Glove_33g157 [Diversispora epigaea]|uniref:Uncharacterized protein n=1 Tax=Diversispora epigaea TaxID=1348612 RepID=A0A397JJ47_9GLOM|nr:hypothetical protein Glove_33g157 [Diversispora epigaea]
MSSFKNINFNVRRKIHIKSPRPKSKLSQELFQELSAETTSRDCPNYPFFRNKSLSKSICSLMIGKLGCSIRWFVNRAEDLKETSFAQFCGCETDAQYRHVPQFLLSTDEEDIKDFEYLTNRLEKNIKTRKRWRRRKAIVFNTYQIYLKNLSSRLKRDFELLRGEIFKCRQTRSKSLHGGKRLMAKKIQKS